MESHENTVLIPQEDKKGKPKELFSIWFATNIGIMGVVYGAIIVSYQLSFIQSILAAAVGALTFALVGYLSLAGRDSGGTTFLLSRAAFGLKGNYVPTFIGWLNLIGWLAVNVVTGTLILLTIFGLFGWVQNTIMTVIGLLIFAGLIIVCSGFGQDTLVKIQSFFTYIFGGLTLFILILLITDTNWGELFSMTSGNWLSGFLPAVSIIAAGTGISWSIAAADYSCYQVKNNSSKSIFSHVTLGAFIPLFIIMTAGILMSTSVPELLTAANPIEAISEALPSWITLVYYVTALGGIIPQCIISLKSARVNMETLNVRVNNTTAVLIHAVFMILIPVYVLFVSQNFLGNFQTFLGVLGIGIASWAAVFLIDYIFLRKHAGYDIRLLTDKKFNPLNVPGISSWIIGVIIGFLFSDTGFSTGPFAKGIFAGNSMGLLLSFIVSGLIYYILISLKEDSGKVVKNEKTIS